MEFFALLIALTAGSVGSVALASLIFLFQDSKLQRAATLLMYFAGGTLLGAAFLGMLRKSIEKAGLEMLAFTLGGIVFFFVMEKIILWRICHEKDCSRHSHAAAPLILIGDAFHNAIDGIVIAASFLTSIELGIFVTISVMIHEIPQELADFGILLKSGYSKQKALWANILSGATALIFGVTAWFVLEYFEQFIPYALAFSASSFMYIALSDLIPEMHKETEPKESIIQLLFIGLGILLILMITNH
jgi:zinc and cadmium transporter